MQMLLECLSRYGLTFLYRPDVTDPQIRWLLGGPEQFGYDSSELQPNVLAFYSLIHPRDLLTAVQSRDAESLNANSPRPITSEYRVRHKNGEYIRVRSILTALPASDKARRPASMEMIRIIDERLSYDRAATKLSEDALSAVLNEIGHPVILMDRAGLIIQANQAAEQICGVLDVATRFCPFLHEPDGSPLAPGLLDRVIGFGQPATTEFHRFDRWWHLHLVPIRDNSQIVMRVLLLAQDITSIKAAQEEKLQHERALTHTLIREVHHRIKNHLQGLVGLMRFHERSRSSDSALVTSAVTQIQSIAAMHGMLARSPRSSVELGSLISEILRAHRDAAPPSIRFNAVLPSEVFVELTENEAIPVAVAISELLTNAAKHTNDAESGEISLILSSDTGGCTLAITNEPARLPGDFHLQDWLSRQSGLTLVLTLLSGSRFRLTFEQNANSVTARLAFRS